MEGPSTSCQKHMFCFPFSLFRSILTVSLFLVASLSFHSMHADLSHPILFARDRLARLTHNPSPAPSSVDPSLASVEAEGASSRRNDDGDGGGTSSSGTGTGTGAGKEVEEASHGVIIIPFIVSFFNHFCSERLGETRSLALSSRKEREKGHEAKEREQA